MPVLKVNKDDELEEGDDLLRVASTVDITTCVNLQRSKRPRAESEDTSNGSTPRAAAAAAGDGKRRRHLVN